MHRRAPKMTVVAAKATLPGGYSGHSSAGYAGDFRNAGPAGSGDGGSAGGGTTGAGGSRVLWERISYWRPTRQEWSPWKYTGRSFVVSGSVDMGFFNRSSGLGGSYGTFQAEAQMYLAAGADHQRVISITTKSWMHIYLTHIAYSFLDKGRFLDKYSNPISITRMIATTVNASVGVHQENGRVIYEHSFDRPIGINRYGHFTSTIIVIVQPTSRTTGEVVTAFPKD